MGYWSSLPKWKTDWGDWSALVWQGQALWMAPGLALLSFCFLFGVFFVAMRLFRFVDKTCMPKVSITIVSKCCGGDPFERGMTSRSTIRVLLGLLLFFTLGLVCLTSVVFQFNQDQFVPKLAPIQGIWNEHIESNREFRTTFASTVADVANEPWCNQDDNSTETGWCEDFGISWLNYNVLLSNSIARDEETIEMIEKIGFGILSGTCLFLFIASILALTVSLCSILRRTKRVLTHLLMWIWVSSMVCSFGIAVSMLMQGISQSTCKSMEEPPIISGFGTVFFRGCLDPDGSFGVLQSSYRLLDKGFMYLDGRATSLAKLHFKKLTKYPTRAPFPTLYPTKAPKIAVAPPTSLPTASPSTRFPTANPSTKFPTANPSTANPTSFNPTLNPTLLPTFLPSRIPSLNPTTRNPSTRNPTLAPTSNPTAGPTSNPTTLNPTTSNPTTLNPTTFNPTNNPTTANPTNNPTTIIPTNNPTSMPTLNPTPNPTTFEPTFNPTSNPTFNPTGLPTTLISRSSRRFNRFFQLNEGGTSEIAEEDFDAADDLLDQIPSVLSIMLEEDVPRTDLEDVNRTVVVLDQVRNMMRQLKSVAACVSANQAGMNMKPIICDIGLSDLEQQGFFTLSVLFSLCLVALIPMACISMRRHNQIEAEMDARISRIAPLPWEPEFEASKKRSKLIAAKPAVSPANHHNGVVETANERHPESHPLSANDDAHTASKNTADLTCDEEAQMELKEEEMFQQAREKRRLDYLRQVEDLFEALNSKDAESKTKKKIRKKLRKLKKKQAHKVDSLCGPSPRSMPANSLQSTDSKVSLRSLTIGMQGDQSGHKKRKKNKKKKKKRGDPGRRRSSSSSSSSD